MQTYQARAYRRPADLPKEVRRSLLQNEAPANVVLPFLKKALNSPCGEGDQLWIALFNGNTVEFVLSCTKGPLANYPIFIVACKSAAQISGGHLAGALLPLVRCLLDEVPPQRVFSVFSVARVTEAFAELFVAEAHARGALDIQAFERPYYDATFTYCTAETLKAPPVPMTRGEDAAIALRPADMSHLEGIKVICKAFSETSPPFVLDEAGAESEAKMLIANQQAWVHTIQKMDQEPEIACLVATTRESDNVTAITKVYTAEHWRGRGCAARLLHRVCQLILQKKKYAVLYVGNSDELAPARKVYHKVGFQGLEGPQVGRVEGVERWLEIGFAGTELGYW